jgi:SAM-dependent methyltransferase
MIRRICLKVLHRTTSILEPHAPWAAHNAPAEALPFPDGVFDLVTCNGVLHHIESIGEALNEVRRVLRQGGIFYADEIPSIHFREALSSLTESSPMSDLLESEWRKVTGDTDRYEELGIDQEATRSAMVQCYQKNELHPENLDALLRAAGFQSVEIRFRWFLGQAQIRDSCGEDAVRRLEEYLTSVLLLTRHLFKNLMIIASWSTKPADVKPWQNAARRYCVLTQTRQSNYCAGARTEPVRRIHLVEKQPLLPVAESSAAVSEVRAHPRRPRDSRTLRSHRITTPPTA